MDVKSQEFCNESSIKSDYWNSNLTIVLRRIIHLFWYCFSSFILFGFMIIEFVIKNWRLKTILELERSSISKIQHIYPTQPTTMHKDSRLASLR